VGQREAYSIRHRIIDEYIIHHRTSFDAQRLSPRPTSHFYYHHKYDPNILESTTIFFHSKNDSIYYKNVSTAIMVKEQAQKDQTYGH
jgi:hypothetical protein